MPLFLLILGVGLLFLFPEKTPENPLKPNDFSSLISMTVQVNSLVKQEHCYQTFKIQPINQNYSFQASSFSCDQTPIKIGDRLNVSLTLKPIQATNSPGAFDNVAWAKQNHIVAQATLKSIEKIGETDSVSIKIQHIREELSKKIHANFKNPDIAAITESLTLGITHYLSWDILHIFNLSGTRHLLAISGAHVGMIALLSYFLFFSLMRILIIFFPYFNAHTAAMTLSLLFIGGYVGLSGEQIPTLRAFFMAMMGLIALFLNRHSSLMYRILISGMIIIALNRASFYSTSFYLSFYAVFLIAYHQYWQSKQRNPYYSYLKLNSLLLLGLLPISLCLFSYYSLISLLSNLIAIPYAGWIILPNAIILEGLSYFGWDTPFLWTGLEWIIQEFIHILTFFSNMTLKIPGIFLTGHINAISALLLSCIFLLAFLPKGMPARYMSLFALIPVLFSSPSLEKGEAQLTFMNVGQGLAILIKTQHHLAIYDTGPHFFTGGDAAQSIIIPYLYFQGWNKIDGMIVSHGDLDHSGGADTLRKNFRIKTILSSDIHRVHGAQLCKKGQHWQWDGVDFIMLYPNKGDPYHGNNSSCVLKINTKKTSALLVGDIEKPVEYYLLEHFNHELKADILSVPHHGSKTSSSDAFLARVQPHYAVFSYGFLNRFHFPHSSILQRYQENNILCFMTEYGSISMKISPLGVTILK